MEVDSEEYSVRGKQACILPTTCFLESNEEVHNMCNVLCAKRHQVLPQPLKHHVPAHKPDVVKSMRCALTPAKSYPNHLRRAENWQTSWLLQMTVNPWWDIEGVEIKSCYAFQHCNQAKLQRCLPVYHCVRVEQWHRNNNLTVNCSRV